MADLTPELNLLLQKHDAKPTLDPGLTLRNIDEFLKEAYRINSHIASLNAYLKAIRQSYLSTAPPPRRTTSRNPQSKYLTNAQRDEIDAETKRLLRELNAGILNLADAEKLRQDVETSLRGKKYGRLGLGALGAWASGGVGPSKSYDQEVEEARASAINVHRENVLWYLRKRIQECGAEQAEMMEKRILREVEKNKSVLAKSRMGGMARERATSVRVEHTPAVHMEEKEPVRSDLTPEQIQMFEKENQDMLKHYASTLDSVKTAEKSLIEISELQTELVNNLALQSVHIDQLVADSEVTTENIGGGNKQLKKATERKSTAKYVFYASCGLSFVLVVWDFLI